MLTRLDRILFRRQAECVPAHRMKDVVAAHAFVARHNICRGVTFGMPDVQPRAARIREHVEDVEFWLGTIEVFLARIGGVKCPAFIPKVLPLCLESVEGIWFAARAHVRLRLLASRAKSRDEREFERDEFAPGNAQPTQDARIYATARTEFYTPRPDAGVRSAGSPRDWTRL